MRAVLRVSRRWRLLRWEVMSSLRKEVLRLIAGLRLRRSGRRKERRRMTRSDYGGIMKLVVAAVDSMVLICSVLTARRAIGHSIFLSVISSSVI